MIDYCNVSVDFRNILQISGEILSFEQEMKEIEKKLPLNFRVWVSEKAPHRFRYAGLELMSISKTLHREKTVENFAKGLKQVEKTCI